MTSADIVAANHEPFKTGHRREKEKERIENSYENSMYLLYVADTYSTVNEQYLALPITVPHCSSNLS